MGGGGEHLTYFLDRVAQAKVNRFRWSSCRRHPRAVQDVIDDGQKRVAAALDRSREILLFGGELRPHEEARHAEDFVHRRSNLVADVGQEFALCTCGSQRDVARLCEADFGHFMRCDVNRHSEHAVHFPVSVSEAAFSSSGTSAAARSHRQTRSRGSPCLARS